MLIIKALVAKARIYNKKMFKNSFHGFQSSYNVYLLIKEINNY